MKTCKNLLLIILLNFVFVVSHAQSNGTLVPFSQGSKMGYRTADGVTVIEPAFDKAAPFCDLKVAIVGNGDEMWVIDLHGDAVSPHFKEVMYEEEVGVFKVLEKDGFWSIYDNKFTPLIKGDYVMLDHVKDGFYWWFKTASGSVGAVTVTGIVVGGTVADNIGFYEGWKNIPEKTYNNLKINSEYMSNSFFVCSKDGKSGIVNFMGNLVVPMTNKDEKQLQKSAESYLKKNKKVLSLSSATPLKLVNDKMLMDANKRNSLESSQKLFPQEYVLPAPIEIVSKKGGKFLAKQGKNISEGFSKIEKLGGGGFIVTNAKGNQGVFNRYGEQTVKCNSKVELFHKEYGYYSYTVDDKMGIVNDKGNVVLLPLYYSVFPYSESIVAIDENDNASLISKDGKDLIPVGKYTKVEYNQEGLFGHLMFYDMDFFASIDPQTGLENEPTLHRTMVTHAQTLGADSPLRGAIYVWAGMFDPDHKVEYLLLQGKQYDEENNEILAERSYKEAANMGSEEAKAILKKKKNDRIMTALEAVGQLLTDAGTAMSMMNQSSGDVQTSGGKHDKAYYQSMYNKWEAKVASFFGSTTLLGGSGVDKAGNIRGNAGGTKTSGQAFVGMNQNVRQAQRRMREVRNEAKRAGFTIQMSKWETAKATYK
ncbi:MAG: hypothetical protein MJZ29_07390 [Bacteroidaceae bacterium]|nr:hypothetical protein [Bacteroidaceae bacterium]